MLLNLHIPILVTSTLTEEDLATTTTRKTPNILRVTTNAPKYLPNQICTASRHSFYNRVFYVHWDIYHAVIYGGLPFLIVLASNIFIVTRLVRYRHHRMIKSSSPTGVTDESDRIKSVQITAMLLSVATLFLLFTGPISIYMTFFYNNLTWMRDSQRSFIRTILTHIAYFNNAINFYVYMCLSSEFRAEWWMFMRRVFYCCCRRPAASAKNLTSLCTTTTTTLGSDERLDDERKRPTQRPQPSQPPPTKQRQISLESHEDVTRSTPSPPRTPPPPKPRKLKPVYVDRDDSTVSSSTHRVQSQQPLLTKSNVESFSVNTQVDRNENKKPLKKTRWAYDDDEPGFVSPNSTYV